MVLPLLIAAALSTTPAKTTPLGLPQFADPPEKNGAGLKMKPTGVIYNSGKTCIQMVRDGAWRCFTTDDMLEAARQSAVTEARAGAATDSAAAVAKVQSDLSAQMVALGDKVSALQSGASALTGRVAALEMNGAKSSDLTVATTALNARIDSVQATAASAVTSAALTAALKPLQDSNTALAGRVTALETTVGGLATQTALAAVSTKTDANASAISALTTRVAALESTLVSQTALASSLATVNARIDALQASGRLCTSTTLSGISIPLTGGLSTVTNVSLPGVPVGTTCTVAGTNRMPLGATGDPIVSTAGAVSVAFRGNGGLLSAIIAIPSGTYRVCCDK